MKQRSPILKESKKLKFRVFSSKHRKTVTKRAKNGWLEEMCGA